MPYATTMARNGTTTAGTANIDLTGTKFAVLTGAFVLGGTTATGMATPTPDGQVRVINLTGSSSAAACGWFCADGSFDANHQRRLATSARLLPVIACFTWPVRRGSPGRAAHLGRGKILPLLHRFCHLV